MPISRSHIGTESYPSAQNLVHTFAQDVTAGNLVVLHASRFRGGDSNPLLASHLTQSAGTATISTPILHHQGTASTNSTTRHGVWSFLVTGTGSLTMTVEFSTSAGVGSIFWGEFAGNWTAGRGGLANYTPNLVSGTTVDSGNATSVGAALFIGTMLTNTGSAMTTTEDAAWELIGEQEAAGQTNAGMIDRIVSGPTTDSASWTLGSSAQYNAAICVFQEGGQFPARMVV